MDQRRAAAIVRHTRVRDGATAAYAAWRARLTTALGVQPGFLRVEVYPPDEAQPDWVSIEWFSSVEHAQDWLRSDTRRDLVEEVSDLVTGADSVTMIRGLERERDVTAVITNRVRPGRVEDFERWKRKIQLAQSRFPGYRGVEVQPPMEGVSPDWVTLLRFDTVDHLRGWLDSAACADLVAESQDFLEHGTYRVSRTSFANWLPPSEQAASPPAWKVNALVLLVLYPVVMLEIIFLYPLIGWLGLGPMTFVGNAISVAVTGFWLVPWSAGWFRTWLTSEPGKQRRFRILGTVVVIACYVASVTAMSLLATIVLG